MNLPEHYLTFSDIRGHLGMVIPIWFPAQTTEAQITQIIAKTVADAEHLVEPSHQILVCDGQPRTQEIIDKMRRAKNLDFVLLCSEQNQGKGGAVAFGVDYLLENTDIDYAVIRDADGDHFINDVPNLMRLASQMSTELDERNIAVVGGRVDVHRPMGFARGEYEILVNDVIWHALQYALALKGRVINMQYFAQYGLIPDLHSGFKLYTRDSANYALEGFRQAGRDMPALEMMRYGSEAIPIVEIILAGGTIGQVNRMTLETQPVTTSKRADRVKTYANKLIWILSRLNIPLTSSEQLLDNAIPRSLLYKDETALEGVMQLRRQVIQALGGTGGAPLFVHAFS